MTSSEFVKRVDEIVASSRPLCTIKVNDLKDDDERFACPTGGQVLSEYRQIASYNWLGTPRNPRIVVPGAPKRFVHWEGRQKLQPDQNLLMADENHYMMSEFPMEPLFQAVKICCLDDDADSESSFKFQDFDIATDRNNLRKLFSIILEQTGRSQPQIASANARPNRREIRPVRIDIQRIGRTICLIRCQEMDAEPAPPSRYATYGRDFERRCTKADNDLCDGSYRQIVSYKFGDLKCLVRFEVDSADYDKSTLNPKSEENPKKTKDEKESKSADLENLLQKISLSEAKGEPFPGSKLNCVRFGRKGRTYHLVELTTRRDIASFPDHVWPQMLFSGTQSLVVGWHKFGFVNRVNRYTFEEVEENYGGFPGEKICRFYYLLEEIVKFVRKKAAAEEKEAEETAGDGKKSPKREDRAEAEDSAEAENPAKAEEFDDLPQDTIYSLIWKPEFNDEIRLYAAVEDYALRAVPEGLQRFIEKN